MRLSDLSDESKRLLAAWFLLAEAYPPGAGEDLPLGYEAALSELAASTGKYRRSRARSGDVIRRGRIQGAPTAGVINGSRREVRARKGRAALAT